jgi:HK97 gp10 family phage protein
MNIETKVDGLKAIDDLLKQLPEKIARRELAGALRAGAGTLRKEALARAPDSPKVHKFGDLKANLRVRRVRPRMGGAIAVAVTTGRAFYAKWLEFGRAAFTVKTKKVLSDGTTVFGTEVGAQPPRPFLRPAFDAAGPRAIEAIAKRLKAGVARQAKRFGLG